MGELIKKSDKYKIYQAVFKITEEPVAIKIYEPNS